MIFILNTLENIYRKGEPQFERQRTKQARKDVLASHISTVFTTTVTQEFEYARYIIDFFFLFEMPPLWVLSHAPG